MFGCEYLDDQIYCFWKWLDSHFLGAPPGYDEIYNIFVKASIVLKVAKLWHQHIDNIPMLGTSTGVGNDIRNGWVVDLYVALPVQPVHIDHVDGAQGHGGAAGGPQGQDTKG